MLSVEVRLFALYIHFFLSDIKAELFPDFYLIRKIYCNVKIDRMVTKTVSEISTYVEEVVEVKECMI